MKGIVFYKDKECGPTSSMVCDSAITRASNPFFMPDERLWHGMVLRGVRIDRLGKGIEPEFAGRYYSECLTAVHPFPADMRDSEAVLWGRDGSLVCSDSVPSEMMDVELRERVDKAIAEISRDVILKTGDLILIESAGEELHIGSPPEDIQVGEGSGCPAMKLKIR